jgi:1-acyl-sn-glycerol-3-phosphate acyltransferase
VRHASTADTILPVALLSAGLGLKLRYVLKSELLWDPCIDVIGQRVPNVFVRRGDAGEVDRVRALARGLGADETLVLYPEGTRFSPSRQAARLGELQSQPEDIQALARALQVTLAPKPGGVLGILDANPSLDVVFCAHTGLEGARTLADLARGELVDKVVKVRFERVPAAEIPTDPAARYRWLLTRWGALDLWIRAQNTAPAWSSAVTLNRLEVGLERPVFVLLRRVAARAHRLDDTLRAGLAQAEDVAGARRLDVLLAGAVAGLAAHALVEERLRRNTRAVARRRGVAGEALGVPLFFAFEQRPRLAVP